MIYNLIRIVIPQAIASIDTQLQPTYFVVFNLTKKAVVKTYNLDTDKYRIS